MRDEIISSYSILQTNEYLNKFITMIDSYSFKEYEKLHNDLKDNHDLKINRELREIIIHCCMYIHVGTLGVDIEDIYRSERIFEMGYQLLNEELTNWAKKNFIPADNLKLILTSLDNTKTPIEYWNKHLWVYFRMFLSHHIDDIGYFDREIPCRICGTKFWYTAGEQKFFKEKNFNDPIRCPECREKLKRGKYNV